VLLLIVAAFLVIGVLSARRISSGLLGVDASTAAARAGGALRRQILGTVALVFCAFLLRSVLSIMVALGRALSNFDKTCKGVVSRCDPTCYNVYSHMYNWMVFAPEFTLITVLISSPITLLGVLWSMTTKFALQLMKQGLADQATTESFQRMTVSTQHGSRT
jgi:hypothetical protein